MSQTTRFQLTGIYNFSKQKAEVERLKESMSGIAEVKLGEDKRLTFVHDPTTTAEEIKKELEKMRLNATVDRIIKN